MQGTGVREPRKAPGAFKPWPPGGPAGMSRVCIRADIDLDATMYPSFLSALFARVRGTWVKLVGYGRGLAIERRGGIVCCTGPACDNRVLAYHAGLWCVAACRSRLRERVTILPEGVRRVAMSIGVAASPWDRESIAIAVYLSRRTSYTVNVLRWVRALLSKPVDPETGSVDVDLVRREARKFTSYQVRQLAEHVEELVKAVRSSSDPATLRRRLLSVPYVGPKVADAILLFTGVTTAVAPYDTHLSKLLTEIGVRHRPPSKTACQRFGSCLSCRLEGCGSAILVKLFGEAAGLVQTAAYVYYSLGGRLERLGEVLRRWEV